VPLFGLVPVRLSTLSLQRKMVQSLTRGKSVRRSTVLAPILSVVWSALLLTGVLSRPTPASADTYYLWDSWGGTWHDAEKTPSNTEDDYMCWAAASANVLEWTGWGDVPGQNFNNEDDIFAYYQDHWTDQGGMMEFGWHWWFDGTNPSQGWEGWSQVDVPGGGFWDPPYDFDNYYHRTWQDDLALAAIDSYLHAGYGTALAVYNGSYGHAITEWGYEYQQGAYEGIYITDSDNSKSSDNPPDTLNYYNVSYNDTDSKWYLQDFYGSNSWYIGEVQGLDRFTPSSSTPEPCSLALLGLGGVGLAALKRRRKRAA